jgi:hypothetical protein
MSVLSKTARVDFRAVSSAALGALDIVVPRLLPGGYRSADEWVARNPTRNDSRPGSFKVNLTSGVWSDFATGDKGGDAIDLMVYLEGKSKLEAARELAAMLNVKSVGAKATRCRRCDPGRGQGGARNVPGPDTAGQRRQAALHLYWRRGTTHPR